MEQPYKAEVMLPAEIELAGPADVAFRDAAEVVIDSDIMRDVAVEERNALRERWSRMEELRKRLKKPFVDGGAYIDNLFRAPMARFEAGREVYDKKILSYNADQERKRAEEQARLEAAAASERKRAEEEARKQQEEADRLAAEAAKAETAEEAERLSAAADEAAQSAAAKQVVAEMIVAPLATVGAKMIGASTRKQVDYEILDMDALIRWIAAQLTSAPHLVNLLVVDGVKMRAFVKTYGPDDGKQQIPGVRIFEKGVLAASKKKAA